MFVDRMYIYRNFIIMSLFVLLKVRIGAKDIMILVDILFIIPPFHRRNGGGKIFPMGIGYIISALESEGYSWEVINCTEMIDSCYEEDLYILEKKLRDMISKISPSVIGVGPCITTQLKALRLITQICGKVFPEVPLFAGGPFASIEGQEDVFFDVLGIDYLIRGDGEEAVVNVIKTLKEKKEITCSKCVSYRDKLVVNVVNDLDKLHFPYRPTEENDIFSVRRKKTLEQQEPMMSMIASRGCPYGCDYCVSGNMKNSHIPFRKRTYKNIISEMKYIKENYHVNNVVFYDDCFFSDKKRIDEEVEAFCGLLIIEEVNMHWQIEMRPDFFILLKDSSVHRLVEAGCSQINLGIEKMSRNSLNFLGKKGSWEGLKEKILSVKKLGIVVCATFILGGEKESEEDIKKLVEDAKELSLDFAQFNPLFVYPGTPFYNRFFESNTEWVQIVLNDKLPWGEIVYENEMLSKDSLLQLVDYAYSEFYKGTPYEDDNMIKDRFNIKGKED